MSLEERLAANTEALKANTEQMAKLTAAIEASNSGREAALAAAANLAGSGGEGPKTTRKKRGEGDAGGAPPAPEKMTLEKFREKAAAFLTVEDEAVLNSRKGFVKEILAHFDVPKLVEVPEANLGEVAAWIEARTKDASFSFKSAEPAAEEEEDDMLG